jgi:hypothetical protein
LAQIEVKPSIAITNYLDVGKIARKTPEHEVSKRDGHGGKIYDYVRVSLFISRLNELFGLAWSFEILDRVIEGKDIAVLGRLTVNIPYFQDDRLQFTQVTKEQWGSHTHYPENELGNTLKAASSDALKKCAVMIGIYADVYDSEEAVSRGGLKEEDFKRLAVQAKLTYGDEWEVEIERIISELTENKQSDYKEIDSKLYNYILNGLTTKRSEKQ